MTLDKSLPLYRIATKASFDEFRAGDQVSIVQHYPYEFNGELMTRLHIRSAAYVLPAEHVEGVGVITYATDDIFAPYHIQWRKVGEG